MNEATFTFRLDESLKEGFTTAAKQRDLSGAQLLRAYMRDFIKQQTDAAQHDAWFRREVQVGIDAAHAGSLVSNDEVEAEASAWRANAGANIRAKLPSNAVKLKKSVGRKKPPGKAA